jgi:hypothetical protein
MNSCGRGFLMDSHSVKLLGGAGAPQERWREASAKRVTSIWNFYAEGLVKRRSSDLPE